MKFESKTFSAWNAVSLLGLEKLRKMRKASSEGWESLISAHFMTRVIQTLYNVGLLDSLREGASVDALEFAARHNLDDALLVGLCNALYERGYLTKRGSRYAIDDGGKFLLETDLVKGWFDLAYGYEGVLNRMEDLLRRKSRYGDDVVRDGRHVAIGSGLASMDFYFPLVAETIRRAGSRKVLDIGCGDATFLCYLCERIPGIQGVGIDLTPDAIVAANELVAARGFQDRISLHVGNALDIARLKPQLEGVDAATTFFVLHELCDTRDNPRAVQFLSAFRGSMPGVPFHVIETIRPEPQELRRRPGMAVEYFLFHDLSLQKPIGREAWKKAFQDAGFAHLHEDYIDFARSAIFTAY